VVVKIARRDVDVLVKVGLDTWQKGLGSQLRNGKDWLEHAMAPLPLTFFATFPFVVYLQHSPYSPTCLQHTRF